MSSYTLLSIIYSIIKIIALPTISLFYSLSVIGQIKFCSWNIANLGKTKDHAALIYISNKLKNFHLVAIQEVNTGNDGLRAIVILDSLLDLTGNNWNYIVSNPTSGKGSERYAYIWNTHIVKLCGSPWLDHLLADNIDREPFMGRFALKNDTFLIANLHIVPSAKNPSKEIILLHQIYELHKNERLIYAGDFNLSFTNNAFDSLKARTYLDAVNNVKTSLKTEIRKGEKFANSYDHILYPSDRVVISESGIVDITNDFESLKACRKISDHVPIWTIIKKNKKWKKNN